jgi:hypothetical protein
MRTRVIIAAAALTAATVSITGIAAAGNGDSPTGSQSRESAEPTAFDEASVHFVDNRSDHDGQLFWSVTYEKHMSDVAIYAPDGDLVAKATFDDLGQADAHFDSPEPSVAELKRRYPAGRYTFTGHTTTGRRLVSVVNLSYAHVRATPVIITPTADQTGVPVSGVVVTWARTSRASVIHLQVESDKPERALEIDLPGSTTSFAIPEGFLQPGTEYVIDVQARHRSGNDTVSDVIFTTAR